MSYFDDWGTIQNPIRQSDLEALFSSKWGCAKRFSFSRLYPKEGKLPVKIVMGDLVHRYAYRAVTFGNMPDVSIELKKPAEVSDEDFAPYLEMCETFKNSKEIKFMQYRRIGCEMSFMVQIGKYWCAGTVDALLKGKKPGEITVLDWKTGHPPISQYEMDKGYQSRIYSHAVKSGQFFRREKIGEMSRDLTGRDYSQFYINQKSSLISYKVWPAMFFVYLREFVPAKKASRRKAAHHSTQSLADKDGYISVKKDERKGPVFYETRPNTGIKRLEYSMHTAVLMAQSGIFPENIGAHCQRCVYQYRCDRTGCANIEEKQQVLNLMNEIGMEPE